MSRAKEIGPLSATPDGLGPRLVSDAAFDVAVARLQAGQVRFTSEEMRRRVGDAIVEKLWELHEQPAEPD